MAFLAKKHELLSIGCGDSRHVGLGSDVCGEMECIRQGRMLYGDMYQVLTKRCVSCRVFEQVEQRQASVAT